ncbi:MAG: hypothetical protein A2Y79_08625 [Deltaproteobacteria bacterium RBG_13_43_22]|nr:MAG: hypothetical protein A2Y79_08625 [Deltaproteobacteria bacterium RBG_13_43_22]
MPIFMLTVALLAIIIHVALIKQRSAKKIVEITLLYLLVISVGAGALISGFMHVFNGPATAKIIGWQPGSPFQYEVGVADMAFGLIGVLCIFFRGSFWLAAIIANGVFLLGCMIGHFRSLAESGNLAAYNIGPNIIIADLILPLLLIGLYIVYQKLRN